MLTFRNLNACAIEDDSISKAKSIRASKWLNQALILTGTFMVLAGFLLPWVHAGSMAGVASLLGYGDLRAVEGWRLPLAAQDADDHWLSRILLFFMGEDTAVYWIWLAYLSPLAAFFGRPGKFGIRLVSSLFLQASFFLLMSSRILMGLEEIVPVMSDAEFGLGFYLTCLGHFCGAWGQLGYLTANLRH